MMMQNSKCSGCISYILYRDDSARFCEHRVAATAEPYRFRYLHSKNKEHMNSLRATKHIQEANHKSLSSLLYVGVRFLL